WRGTPPRSPPTRKPPLQRSRTRWSAESRLKWFAYIRHAERFNGAALVGVRRGYDDWVGGLNRQHFNGAALVGVRRGHAGLPGRLPNDPTSTEPHSLECGEGHPPGAEASAVATLQRSRTRWSTERLKNNPKQPTEI